MNHIEKVRIVYKSITNKVKLEKFEKGIYFNQISKALKQLESKEPVIIKTPK